MESPWKSQLQYRKYQYEHGVVHVHICLKCELHPLWLCLYFLDIFNYLRKYIFFYKATNGIVINYKCRSDIEYM